MLNTFRHRHKRLASSGGLGVIWLLVGGCADRPEIPRPDVILISIDTLRADRLGAYGFAADTSPNLDRLASLGVRFENAFSQSSWTLPAHMSLFTSQAVDSHRVSADTIALRAGVATLTEVLKSNGYRTGAFASWIYLNPNFGFGRGFDEYYLQIDPGQFSMGSGGGAHNASKIVDAVSHWLASSDDHPYFLFVHFFDPHLDYRAPPPYDQLFAGEYSGPVDGTYDQIKPHILGWNQRPEAIDPADREHLDALYQGEIRFVDDQIGRLLEAIDSRSTLDKSLLVVVSDHGEELGDHGSLEGHGWTLYEEITRVPMMIRFPARAYRGMVVKPPVGLIDVAPTILDFLRIEPPEAFQGRSLLPLLDPPEVPVGPRTILSDSGGRFGIFKRAVRGPRFKLIETKDTGMSHIGLPIEAGYELYDLENDPHEGTNIYDPEHPAVAELLEALAEASRRSSLTDGQATEAVELSDQEKEMLKSLGYIQ